MILCMLDQYCTQYGIALLDASCNSCDLCRCAAAVERLVTASLCFYISRH